MRLLNALLISLLLPPLLHAGPVDINTADAATLARELRGVGEARAQAIVEYRKQHGPFRSADELAMVRNIPQKVIEDNRANIRVDQKPVVKPGTAARDPKARAANPPPGAAVSR